MLLNNLAKRRALFNRGGDASTVLKHALQDRPFGKTALVSSFGAESVVLLHMVSQIDPDTPVLFLNTEMLFPETLSYQQEVAQALGLTDMRVIRPARAALLTHDVDGILHTIDPDACCSLRKTAPLEQALQGFDAWITGRKRVQGGQRATLPLYEKDEAGRTKINPLAGWDPARIADYIAQHKLPRHPLVARGFKSLGCAPCTTRVADGEDPRAGRWRGLPKTECGIHFEDGKTVKREHAA